MNNKNDKGWNPYVAGALSGLVLILSVAVSGNYFGSSTSFIVLLGMLEKALIPERFAQVEYFNIVKAALSWQVMFVLGILLGGFIASKMFGDFKLQSIPDLWKSKFGTSKPKRYLVAFIGGTISMLGARLAGGCPSGQMSASILLSVSGFVSMIMFFILGIIVAKLIYRGGAR
ncbi:YeeE/YedE thiosulfate transporter family protein [Alkalibacter mobilis]|uniref:YeeE/YedE thiosulfate transporter family protein n=1 Tax=Alkalibacter mobilis TaxID=2787712 RepID=UPI00189FFC8A|nr:YeeE/YedE thiosulfate transporter family protein [Alkalibacter mobilis]MBF7096250.1 YeeE/YedE family protein [Alkalibacter mobilis]